MSRYEPILPWREEKMSSVAGKRFALELADARDKKTGDVFRDGAYRVTINGRPHKAGKGGTVPFYGESAWSDGERLYGDLVTAARFARSPA